MAQVFPLNGLEPAERPGNLLAATLAALPDPWTLLIDRRIDDTADVVDVVLVHPEIGIALVEQAPRDPGPAIGALRARLEGERFGEFFQGELPIVGLSVTADELAEIGDKLANAFDAAPRLTIDDRDWADAVIELLLEPSDLSMAPMAGHAAQTRPALRTTGDPATALPDPEAHGAPRGETSLPPLHLMSEWRPSAEERSWRRNWHWAAVAASALLLVGGIGLAWNAGEEEAPAVAPMTPSQVELTLPPAQEAQTASQRVSTRAQEPPPVPPRPLRVFAAKPMQPPPRPLPHFAHIEAPKFVAKEAPAPAPTPSPTPAPAQTAEAAPPPAASKPPATEPPPPAQAQKPAPAPQAAAKPEAEPVVKRPPPTPTRHVAAAPARAPQHAPERSDHPPIDAADLPPLDDVAPTPPPAAAEQTAEATPRREPPAHPPEQIGDTPPPPRIGPPIPLSRAPWQSQSGTSVPSPRNLAEAKPHPASEAPPNGQECRPYTADTTLTGRNLPVRGMACRGADGQWRLVSELPAR